MTSPRRERRRSCQTPFELEQDATFVHTSHIQPTRPKSQEMNMRIALSSTRISVAVSSLDTIPSYGSGTARKWDDPSSHDPALALCEYADQTNGEKTLIHANELPPVSKPRTMEVVEGREAEHHARPSLDCCLTARDPAAYTIVGTIGRGTHGKVVLAYLNDEPLTDFAFYAMKVIPGNRSTPEIQKEIAVLHIVSGGSTTREYNGDEDNEGDNKGLLFLQQLYEVFYDQEACFIVMEYHPATLSDPEIAARFKLSPVRPIASFKTSPSLPAYMHAEGPIQQSIESLETSLTSILLLAAEIILGLRFLHAKGIIHQDIKPANIMISHGGHAVVGDFGAASQCEEAPYIPDLGSESLSFLPIRREPSDYVTFTPTYAAPELRERNEEGCIVYDMRSDWWSLGVLLHELSTGSVPGIIQENGDELVWRRSEGDLSLSFGKLEAVEKILLGSAEGEMRRRISDLRSFLHGLLASRPSDRLDDDNVQSHPFLDPLSSDLLWDEVAEGRHPPCPNPEVKHLVDERDCSYLLDGVDYQSDSQDSSELIFHTCYDDHGSHSSLRRYGVDSSPMSSLSSNNGDQRILRWIPSTASILPFPEQAAEHPNLCHLEDVFTDSSTSFSHRPSTSNAPQPTILVSAPRPHIEEEQYVLTLPEWITNHAIMSNEAATSNPLGITPEPGSECSETPLDKIQPSCLLGSPFEESTPAAVRRRLRHQHSSDPSSSLLFHDSGSPLPSFESPQTLPAPPGTIDWSLGYRLLEQEDNLPEALTIVLLQAMDIRDKNASRMTAQHEQRLYKLHEMVQKRHRRRPRKLKKTQQLVTAQPHNPQAYMHPRENSLPNVSAARRFWGCMQFWEDVP